MKTRYTVRTHLGVFTTYAASPKKALANIRFRLFGRAADSTVAKYWDVSPFGIQTEAIAR